MKFFRIGGTQFVWVSILDSFHTASEAVHENTDAVFIVARVSVRQRSGMAAALRAWGAEVTFAKMEWVAGFESRFGPDPVVSAGLQLCWAEVATAHCAGTPVCRVAVISRVKRAWNDAERAARAKEVAAAKKEGRFPRLGDRRKMVGSYADPWLVPLPLGGELTRGMMEDALAAISSSITIEE